LGDVVVVVVDLVCFGFDDLSFVFGDFAIGDLGFAVPLANGFFAALVIGEDGTSFVVVAAAAAGLAAVAEEAFFFIGDVDADADVVVAPFLFTMVIEASFLARVFVVDVDVGTSVVGFDGLVAVAVLPF